MPFLPLIAPWLGLIKIAAVVGLFWYGYSLVWDRGYNARDVEYQNSLRAANARIESLNAELEATYRAREAERETVAEHATAGIPDYPDCAKSKCALTPEAIGRLNGIN
jgi:hypothetical protein